LGQWKAASGIALKRPGQIRDAIFGVVITSRRFAKGLGGKDSDIDFAI